MNGTGAVYDYIGLDVHKKVIAFCVKDAAGAVLAEGRLEASRAALTAWARGLRRPWIGALEATLFSGWIYDQLQPFAVRLLMAHPEMLKAIGAAKKKTDKIDAAKIADLLRCDLLPVCYVAPAPLRELKRALRFRGLMVRQAVKMLNKMNGLLMEVGAPYESRKLKGKKYFRQLTEQLQSLECVPQSVLQMLGYSRAALELFQQTQRRIQQELLQHPLLKERVERLMTVPGVGAVTALTWALEIGEPQRFSNINQAVSYCGLCAALRESAGKQQRGPLSKKRNPHLQTVLIEAAHLAPRFNDRFAAVYSREYARSKNANQATLAVARGLVALLLTLDRRQEVYDPQRHGQPNQAHAAAA